MHLIEKLDAIAATKAKGEKLDIVRTFTGPERLIIQRALDPTVTYFIAKLAPLDTAHGTSGWGPEEDELLTKLATRQLTGDAALETVRFHMMELNPKDAELLRRVIIKDLRAGIGANTVNTAFPGLIPEFAYMRCSLPKDSNMKKWDWTQGMCSQLKANGMFARIAVEAGRVLITTRQGNTFPVNASALAALRADAEWALGDNTETHGELTVWRSGECLPRSQGNGMLNSVMEGGEMDEGCEVRFDAWDQIPLIAAVPNGKFEKPYAQRLAELTVRLQESAVRTIMLIEHRWVSSYAEALAHYKEILARKLEGTVVKHHSAIWRDGDSKDQVKFKLEVDVDLKIVGFNPGTPGTRTEATFGSVICRTADDQLEVSVAGFKRDMEQYLHENRDSVLGKIMCVRANEVSPPCDTNELHSLYHPRVVELRKDKDKADTLQRVLDQFEAAIAA